MLEISDVEQHLSQNGKFSLLDWLLSENFLSYADYEAWRYGKMATLDNNITVDKKTLSLLLESVQKHADTLKLSTQEQDYFSWQEGDTSVLSASKHKDLHRQLTQHWLRAQDQPQLDLFMDNSAAIAENKLLAALGARQWTVAREYLTAFTEHNPNHGALGRYLDLINYGDHMLANNIIDPESIKAEFDGLQQEVVPLAKETLGDYARDYLAYAWRRIAYNLNGVKFCEQQPTLHRSFALRQIPDWQAIQNDLKADSQLYQHPQLLEHFATSYAVLKQVDASLVLWCHIIEQFPDYAETELEQDSKRPIYSLWQQFWDVNDQWSEQDFPAFVLLKTPAAIHVIDDFESLKNSTTTAMLTLLQQRQQGGDEIEARKYLQQASPLLLTLYLQQYSSQ